VRLDGVRLMKSFSAICVLFSPEATMANTSFLCLSAGKRFLLNGFLLTSFPNALSHNLSGDPQLPFENCCDPLAINSANLAGKKPVHSARYDFLLDWSPLDRLKKARKSEEDI